jgi:hypothetical protein
LRFALDPDAAAGMGPAAESIAAHFGPVDPARQEPIINFIQDIFEGRLVG